MSRRALLLSAYAARSHCHWAQALQTMLPGWQWTLLELPPRHFSWRVRGNPLYWSETQREVLESGHDLLVATSMVDLATLRGLVPALASLPSLLYFHENQFAYPRSPHQHSLVEAQMVSLYSALAADRLAFNSAWNRDSFLQGCDQLLRKLPDCVPSGVVDKLAVRSRLLPVPIAPPDPREAVQWPGRPGVYPARPLRLVWVGRLEYDKGLEGLLAVMAHLSATGLAVELAVVGQVFREIPAALVTLRARHGSCIVHCGDIPQRADYLALLRGADVVLSTALHEFQGLAVLEAVARGCLPVVPDRLAYPEHYPARFRYPDLPRERDREAAGAAALINDIAAQLSAPLPPVDVSELHPDRLGPRYHALLAELVAA